MADDGERPGADNRSEQRSPLEYPVRLEFATTREALDGVTSDLSPGGMFVADENPRPIGTMVRFVLSPEGAPPVQGLGEVAWIRVRWEGHERPAGMGIQFRAIDAQTSAMIEGMIAAAARRAPAPRRDGGTKPLKLIPPPPNPDGVEPLRPDPPPKPKRPPKASNGEETKGGKRGAKGEQPQKLFADIRTKKGGRKGAKKGDGSGSPGLGAGGADKRTYALLGILLLLLLVWMC